MYLFIILFFLITLFFVFFFHYKKKKILQKLCSMTECEKCCLLDELVSPLGYCFDCSQGIFSTRLDAWQKDFGYTYAFDRFAPFFNMVFDSQPVYFDYGGRTWLIEFWKGQYGITTGCEIGVYHADAIIPAEKRKKTLFHAVHESEMPEMSLTLRKRDATFASLQERHWWLTCFCMGAYSRPQELCMDICLTFPNSEMLSAFIRALLNLGYSSRNLSVCGYRICFTFSHSCNDRCNVFCRLNRSFSLWRCKQLCKLYNHIVRPLKNTTDQLLYLYFYLPSRFRRTLLLHTGGCKCRRKQRKIFKYTRKNTK